MDHISLRLSQRRVRITPQYLIPREHHATIVELAKCILLLGGEARFQDEELLPLSGVNDFE